MDEYDAEAARRKQEVDGLIGMAAFAVGFAATKGALEARRGEPRPRGVVDQAFDGFSELGYGLLAIMGIVLAIIYWKIAVITGGVAVLGWEMWQKRAKKAPAAPDEWWDHAYREADGGWTFIADPGARFPRGFTYRVDPKELTDGS